MTTFATESGALMAHDGQAPPFPSVATPERIPTRVLSDSKCAGAAVAAEIADLIKRRANEGRPCVLGLATGSTPTGVYAELIRLHREEKLSFKNVITFNLDEYFPMPPESVQSYHRFMREQLFDHVDIDPANVHLPKGTLAAEAVPGACAAYEKAIRDAGGVDLQILGIGRTGHIGFNEPGSSRESRTRLITLDRVTRLDAASDFYGEQYVPRRAITMGVGTILEARRVIMLAFGEGKAPVVSLAVEGPQTASISASFLQTHPNATVYLDEAAAAQLTRFRSPWMLGLPVVWNAQAVRKAVIWLSRTLAKPILHLTDEDYNEGHLQDLLASHGSAYDINLSVFRALQESITGWPGGKPDSLKRRGDINRPSDRIFPKRVLVFSPHPDDDVISMGGTLIRLADQGHDVHVGYQTSGNIAVFDADVLRFVDFSRDLARALEAGPDKVRRAEDEVTTAIRSKEPGQVDSALVQRIKALIRRGEARAAGRECGLPGDNLHFLDLPFYETGTVRKNPIGEEDINIVAELLRKIRPHQIYAAGDLSDPHGTHRVCLAAVFAAFKKLAGEPDNEPWIKDCEIWLYRGAWQEWEPDQIEMAVPLSPREMDRKRNAIFKHQSQKDRAMFPGSDEREFWKRAEDRNRTTAKLYDQLGMAQYAAIEGFVKWDGK